MNIKQGARHRVYVYLLVKSGFMIHLYPSFKEIQGLTPEKYF